VPVHSSGALRMRCSRMEDRAGIAALAFNFARQLGFDQRSCWEVCIVVQELVSNLVRHAQGGDIELRSGLGLLEVRATDSGPGIPLAVLQDRHRWARGLGAVQRLMHELEIGTVGDPTHLAALGMSSRDGGTCILARRYLEKVR